MSTTATCVNVIDTGGCDWYSSSMAVDERQLYHYIGQRLKDQRGALGLTQQQVARQTGVERTSITNIEAGRQKLPLHLLYHLCDVLEIDVREVLPAASEIRTTEEEDVIEVDGRPTRVPRRTASFVRTVLISRAQDQ